MIAPARVTLAAARAVALLGCLVAGAAAAWLALFTTSVSVHWVYPDGYVTALFLAAALVVNAVLFARADVMRAGAAVGVTLISLCASALIIAVFAHAMVALPT